MPSFDGLAALKISRERCPDVPFIFVSGALGEEMAIDLLKKGATDYVLKNRLSRLEPAVSRALHEVEERTERERAEHALTESEVRYRTIFENTGTATAVDFHRKNLRSKFGIKSKKTNLRSFFTSLYS